jgi:3-deoxy-D-manno-octulosonic-acid transferase
MYNLIIYLYLLGVAIASLFNEKVRKMWRGERDAFRVLRKQVDPSARYVWFHAASLGEFEQGRPLMERLRREHPEYKILLTFFSPSGYEVRKNYEGADIICYLPLDTIRNARRFLRAVRPCMAFFIKYEFWFNYLHILKHRQVPVYSVSSIFRPEQVFFRWYGRQYGRVLKCFTRFFVQNEQSRELLKTLGITDVEVVGDTRFDRVLQIKEQAKQLPLVEQFIQGAGNPHVFVAGSSWPPDEEIFLRFFREHPEWTLIIAQHVIGEDHLQQIEKLLDGFHVERYTQLKTPVAPPSSPEEAPPSSPEGDTNASSASTNAIEAPSGAVGGAPGAVGGALIIDCFGLLSSIYRYGQVAYVGGGFGVGIHNVLEAAVWGCPVVFGPNNERFQEAQELKAAGGGFDIKGYDDFARLMDSLSADADRLASSGQKAACYVQSRAGATRTILADVGC